jgi:hypothetical protein
MIIKFNIEIETHKYFDQNVCNEFKNHFPDYYISCYNDPEKIVLKRRHLSTTDYGYNIRNAMNTLKDFEIYNKNEGIQVLININPLLFILIFYLIILISFSFVFEYSIYSIIILLITYSITMLNFFIGIGRIIEFVKEIFR